MRYLGRKTERPRNGNGHFLQKSESLYWKVNGEGLPIIHIPGKERILACLSEQLQVKKGEKHPSISPSVSSGAEVRSSQTSEQPPPRVFSKSSGQRIHPSDLDIRSFPSLLVCGVVGCVLRSHCLFLFPWLFSSPHEAFSLRSSGPHATIKGLNLKFNYALPGQWSVSQIIEILLMTWQGESQPGQLEPGRGEGNVETTKMGLWEKDLPGARGFTARSWCSQGPIRKGREEPRFGESQRRGAIKLRGGRKSQSVRQKTREIFQVLSSHQQHFFSKLPLIHSSQRTWAMVINRNING